ncbi:elongation factor Ts [Candidatus Kaiserbacteria bacterium]|nr:elongation factor Ts [Candidatus Kaiserbacteria bacterium]
MAITSEQVKELRNMTGISVMQCKAALEEAGGDKQKALLILSKKGGAIAAKKSDRALGAGVVSSYIHANKEVGSMVVLRSETDFVSKNEEFVNLAKEIALQVAASNPLYVKREDIPPEKLEEMKGLFVKEVEGKAEKMKETILTGKLDAYLKGIVLLEQPYIKDDGKTIRELIENAIHKFGERVEVERFIRFSTK